MTKKSLKLISMFTLLMAAAVAQAEVRVSDAWVRATVAQQMATGAFMRITSSKDVRLVSVRTSAAGIAEIHEMKMDNNIMKMREIAFLALPAGKTVELTPGGFHVMLMDLKAQIKEGDSIPLTLIVEDKDKKRETIDIVVKARALNSNSGKM